MICLCDAWFLLFLSDANVYTAFACVICVPCGCLMSKSDVGVTQMSDPCIPVFSRSRFRTFSLL